ncbi:glycosyltransferase family A protein [uncultured Formosa sp.]|uniref:glycosyltransferase family A protein n=1 Tax=uncultured Formosa sp. TaxID=255435 RepID=UPI002601F0F5|nr:glycosyltransferase family A protein [uncultured Formosa sp.]
MTEKINKTGNIAIVIPTFNRKISFQRLLHSIDNAFFSKNRKVDLIISIDYSQDNSCSIIAEEFNWEFGEKKIIKHEFNLGLKKHILFCGDLVKDYDAIIMLEDDLWVSPNFYNYATQSYEFFKDDPGIGQISLYAYQYDENSFSKFFPIINGKDNYFMQIPSSWGQLWTKSQWERFRKSFDQGELDIMEDDLLPNKVIYKWSSASWKKHFYKYLVQNNLYVVYPYYSLTTNFADAGTNFSDSVSFYQTHLNSNLNKFDFCVLDEKSIIYDYNFELCFNSVKHFVNFDSDITSVELDLNGQKDLSKVQAEYLISTKKCNKPIKSFGSYLLPQELNIFYNTKGEFYVLAKTSDFVNEITWDKVNERNIQFIPTSLKNFISKKIKFKYESSFLIRNFLKMKTILRMN